MSNFMTLTDIGMAYRKAKVDVFYATVPNRLDLLAYEQDLAKNLAHFYERLRDNRDSALEWVQSDAFIGDYLLAPKGIKGSRKTDDFGIGIYSDPNQQWENRQSSDEHHKPVAEFRLMAKPSVDFHILSALWITKVGHLYDEKLMQNSYGSRLRRTHVKDSSEAAFGELNPLSLGSFKHYLGPFQQWRDNGLKAMRESLENEEPIVAITSDVHEFYHKLNPKFLLDKDFLTLINLELGSDEEWLTHLLIKAIEAWGAKTPINDGLPVGVAASALIANVALAGLDQLIIEEIAPIYYGRYVDDIILVLDASLNYKSIPDLSTWIVERSKNQLELRKGENHCEGIAFIPKYHDGSEILFSGKKSKVFMLEGSTGRVLVDSLVDEINTRASEWRGLPSLARDSKDIASDLVSAASSDGERADNLRKADSLSMRRSAFALKIRDFEAYEHDLMASEWEEPRRAFINTFTEHVLALPLFFELATYLPRIIRLATACGDFQELKALLLRLDKMYKLVSNTCKVQIAACPDQSTPGKGLIMKRWAESLELLIDESIKASAPKDLFRVKKQFEELSLSGDNNGLRWAAILEEVQRASASLFKHDLAYYPLRVIGLPKEVSIGRQQTHKVIHSLPAMKKDNVPLTGDISCGVEVLFEHLANNEHHLSPKMDECESPPEMDKCNRGLETKECCKEIDLSDLKLPLGFLFPTRPFNLLELQVIFDDPYSDKNACKIESINLALRGYSVKQFTPKWSKCKKEYPKLTVPSSSDSENVVIGLTSWLTEESRWEAMAKQEKQPNLERYERLMTLMNATMKSKKRPDYVVLPEVALPARWFLSIARKLHRKGIGLISGIEYQHTVSGSVTNQVWAALPQEGHGFPTMSLYRQDKQVPALGEESALWNTGGVKLSPQNLFKEFNGAACPPVIQHGGFHFGILICSEFTNIQNRSLLRGQIDALFVPKWNKDTETFNALVESAALDIHAYIVQCNNRLYGDSRLRAPYKERWERDVLRINGGLTDYFVIGKINVKALRHFQSYHRSPTEKAKYKPVPDGFKRSASRR